MNTWTKKVENLMLVIWVQALLATAGSLFYSEVMEFVPCELCWYQRIFMYPLVIIYGAALLKKDVRIAFSGVILSGIGMFISTYHYLLQKVPALHDLGAACSGPSCTAIYVNYFGFVTIPFMAGIAFIVIFVLHILLLREMRRN